jgi:hypothetical protein
MLDNYWNLVLSKKKIGSRKERTFVTALLHLACSRKKGEKRIEVSLLFRFVITVAVIVGLTLRL